MPNDIGECAMSECMTDAEYRVDSLSTAVIDEIAAHEGVDPMDLKPPLYDVIDPDALDMLFPDPGEPSDTPTGRVVFTYCGYEVEVTSTGGVRISDSRTL